MKNEKIYGVKKVYKKGQFTIEFIMLFSFTFLIFLLFVGGMTVYLDSKKLNSDMNKLEIFAEGLKRNIVLVHESESGFQVQQYIPEKIDDIEVNITTEIGILYVINKDSRNRTIYKSVPKIYGNFETGQCNLMTKIGDGVQIGLC